MAKNRFFCIEPASLARISEVFVLFKRHTMIERCNYLMTPIMPYSFRRLAPDSSNAAGIGSR